jgi:hypothetical protein
MSPKLTHRSTLLRLAGAVTLGRASLALAAAATDRRFVVLGRFERYSLARSNFIARSASPTPVAHFNIGVQTSRGAAG